MWSEERRKQVEQLENLLRTVELLDYGTGFLGKVKKCIQIAEDLSRSTLLKASFLHFIIEEATKEEATKEEEHQKVKHLHSMSTSIEDVEL